MGHRRQQLLAWVEGGLDAAERARLEQHMADCAACRTEAAELLQVHDNLGALPAALRGLTGRPAGSWAVVWARVQGAPARPMVPQLNFCLSLAVVVFVLAAALPAGLGAQPVPVTAGAIQTPIAAHTTPPASTASMASAGQVSTAFVANRVTPGARAIPVPTPIPGVQG